MEDIITIKVKRNKDATGNNIYVADCQELPKLNSTGRTVKGAAMNVLLKYNRIEEEKKSNKQNAFLNFGY